MTDQPMNVALMDQLGAIAFVFACTTFVVLGLWELSREMRIRRRIFAYTDNFIVLDQPPEFDVRAAIQQRRRVYLKEQRDAK